MVRVIVDKSYTTHVQTCIISASDHYSNTQQYSSYRSDHVQLNDYVLIEDSWFDTIITHLSWYTSEPCTVSQFKSVINREIALWQIDHHISTQIMTFLISETQVNHEIVQSPRWHIGQIQCNVQLIMLKSKMIPKHIIADCKKWYIHLIPKSLYTIEHINQQMKLSDYALVYLCDYMVKCIVVKDWQYHRIEYLNRGLKELRNLMEEMNVWQYYHAQQCQNINHLTRKLITKAVDQYAHILGQWLSHHVWKTNTIAMINQLSDHQIINEQFNHYLSQNYWFYTIEYSHSFPRISKHADIDGQIYLHHIDTIATWHEYHSYNQ